jgi:hypothetical protein
MVRSERAIVDVICSNAMRARARLANVVGLVAAVTGTQSLACTSDPPAPHHCSGGPGVYDPTTCQYEGPPAPTGNELGGGDGDASDDAQVEAGASASDASQEDAGASDAATD